MTDEKPLETLPETIVEGEAYARLEAHDVQMRSSAIGSAAVNDLETDMSALGGVSADGSASIDMSAVGGIAAKGDVTVERGLIGGVAAGGNVSLGTGLADAVLAAGDVHAETLGAGAVAARSVTISKGWVGVVASPQANIAEDVKVVLDPKGAAWLGIAFGVAFGLVYAVTRAFTGSCCEE